MQQNHKNTMLAVIVLYNMKLEDSATYQTLKASLGSTSASEFFGIIVYDNSPLSQAVESKLLADMLYVHDAENGGVAKAYNYALDIARQRGNDWLLLLDQDSELPVDFVGNCWSDIQAQQGQSSTAAIVPIVYCGSKLISPCKAGFGGKVYPVMLDSKCLPKNEITAINSGVLVRVDFLDSIGGFNNDYWLDMLDHWLFQTIYSKKMSVAVGKNKIHHNLSIHNYSTISLERYKNIITAESRFNLTDTSFLHKTVFRFRLIIRVFKFLFIHNRNDLSALTRSYIFRGIQ